MITYYTELVASFKFPKTHELFITLKKMIENDIERRHTEWLFWNGKDCFMINYVVLRMVSTHIDALKDFDVLVLSHLGQIKGQTQLIKIEME